MQNSLREALRAVFTLDVTGCEDGDKKLCLLPGIYDTERTNVVTETKTVDGEKVVTGVTVTTTYDNPANLVNAGYACDQVADDGGLSPKAGGVAIQAVGRAKMRDFLHQVQRVGMRCTEIVIKNLAGSTNEEIFNTQIELAKTVVGARGGMDFITLQKYVNVNAYDRSKITIDLSGVDENGRSKALDLTPEVFMAMTVPQDAHFTIQFTFDNTVSGI